MFTLQVASDSLQLLRRGFEGRAIAAPGGIVNQQVFWTFLSHLEESTSVVARSMYYNELEKLVFEPLHTLANSVVAKDGYEAGAIAKKMYSNGVAYALIAEYLTLTQVKDVGQRMSLEMVSQSPIYLAAQDASSRANKQVDPGDDPIKEIPALLQQYLGNVTPTKVLDSFIRASSGSVSFEQDQMETLQASYQRLSQFSSKGKGFPLSRSRRKQVMLQRATIITAIDQLWDYSSTTMTAEMYDSLTLAYAYSLYLQLESDYDVNFPATPFQLNSMAWAQTMRASASKLSSLFAKIATAPFSLDVSLAIKLWEAESDFFSDFLPRTSQMQDMRTLWDKYKSVFSRIENTDFSSMLDSAWDKIKSLYGATTILPPSYAAEVNKVKPDGLADKSPRDIIDKIVASKSFSIEFTDRARISSMLIQRASSVTAAIDYLAQAVGILSLNFQPEGEFVDVTSAINIPQLPLVGTAIQPGDIPFTMVDQLSPALEKYDHTVKDNNVSSEWIWHKHLLQPKFMTTLIKESLPMNPLIMWSPGKSVPLAAVLTQPYLQQPAPVCYTASRSRAANAYAIQTYIQMLDGSSMGVAASEILDKAADLFHLGEEAFTESVVNSMAAVGFWYSKKKSGSWVLIKPSLPTIYGVPTLAFSQKNSLAELAKVKFHTVDQHHSQEIVPDKDADIKYKFVLHAWYPLPMVQSTISWSPVPGLDMQVKINQNDYNLLVPSFRSSSKDLIEEKAASIALSESIYANSDLWSAPGGLYPVMINMPHLLFDVWVPDSDFVSSLVDAHTTSVAQRLHPVTGNIVMRAFWDDEVVILDLADSKSAMIKADPVPGISSATNAEEIKRDEPGKEAPTSAPATPPVDSTAMVPHSEDSAAKAAAGVSTATIVTRVDQIDPRDARPILSGTDSIKVEPLEAAQEEPKAPSLGDPTAPQKVESGSAPTPALEGKPKRYKKRREDGTWEYIEVKPGDAVPSGFIPAEAEDAGINSATKPDLSDEV